MIHTHADYHDLRARAGRRLWGMSLCLIIAVAFAVASVWAMIYCGSDLHNPALSQWAFVMGCLAALLLVPMSMFAIAAHWFLREYERADTEADHAWAREPDDEQEDADYAA